MHSRQISDSPRSVVGFSKAHERKREAAESEFEDGEFKPIEGIKDYLKADLKKYTEPFVYKRLNKTNNNRLCFAKTFSDGNKIILIYSVVGDFGNIKNGSITNFEKRKLNDIITKIESGDVRYISPTLKTRLQTTASTSNTPLVAVGTLLMV